MKGLFYLVFILFDFTVNIAEPSFYFGTENTCPGGANIASVAECETACNQLKLEKGVGFKEGSLCFKNINNNKCRQSGNRGVDALLICKKGKVFITIYTYIELISLKYTPFQIKLI